MNGFLRLRQACQDAIVKRQSSHAARQKHVAGRRYQLSVHVLCHHTLALWNGVKLCVLVDGQNSRDFADLRWHLPKIALSWLQGSCGSRCTKTLTRYTQTIYNTSHSGLELHLPQLVPMHNMQNPNPPLALSGTRHVQHEHVCSSETSSSSRDFAISYPPFSSSPALLKTHH